MRAMQDVAVDDDARPHAGTDRQVDEHVHAAPCTGDRLTETRSVGIVFDSDWHAQPRGQPWPEVDRGQTKVHYAVHHPSGSVQRARHCTADRTDPTPAFPCDQLLQRHGDGCHQCVGVSRRGQTCTRTVQKPAVVPREAHQGFRGSDVDGAYHAASNGGRALLAGSASTSAATRRRARSALGTMGLTSRARSNDTDVRSAAACRASSS